MEVAGQRGVRSEEFGINKHITSKSKHGPPGIAPRTEWNMCCFCTSVLGFKVSVYGAVGLTITDRRAQVRRQSTQAWLLEVGRVRKCDATKRGESRRASGQFELTCANEGTARMTCVTPCTMRQQISEMHK